MYSLHTGRSNHRVVVCQGNFYAIGGFSTLQEDLATCETISVESLEQD